MTERKRIRFITSDYKDLFMVEDGGKILFERPGYEPKEMICRYVDSYHVKVNETIYHICQFAEMCENVGAKCTPIKQEKGKNMEKIEILNELERKIGCVIRNATDYLEEDEFEWLCNEYGIIPSCFRVEESNVVVFKDRATAYDWLKRVNLIDSEYVVVESCGICKRCGASLFESDITDYKYQCFTCDEDFYSFEQENETKICWWVIEKPVADCAGGYIDNKIISANRYSKPDGYDSNVATFNTPKAARMWLRENKLLNKGYKIAKITL